MQRIGVLLGFLLLWPACNLFSQRADDDVDDKNYIAVRGKYVMKDGVLYDDGDMVRAALEEATQQQLGHGIISMVPGSVTGDPVKLPDGTWDITGTPTNVPCPIKDCKGHLVDINQRQHCPWGRDSDDDDDTGRPIYARFGQCNVCLSRRWLPESYDEPAPPLETKEVAEGLPAIVLPSSGFFFPRLPAALRLPINLFRAAPMLRPGFVLP